MKQIFTLSLCIFSFGLFSQNVGVSDDGSTPNQLLHIHENGSTGKGLKITNSTTGNGASDGVDLINDGNDLRINQLENAAVRISTNGSERMTILGNGNVGIGNSNPQTGLDVSGGVISSFYVSRNGNSGSTDMGVSTFERSVGNHPAGDIICIGKLHFATNFTHSFKLLITGYFGSKTYIINGYQSSFNLFKKSEEAHAVPGALDDIVPIVEYDNMTYECSIFIEHKGIVTSTANYVETVVIEALTELKPPYYTYISATTQPGTPSTWSKNEDLPGDDLGNHTATQSVQMDGNSLLVGGDDGITVPTGNYGSIMTTGSGLGGYEGFSINGRYNLMSSGNGNVGLYNDVDNRWIIHYSRNSYLRFYDPDGGSEIARFNADGNFGIGSNAPTQKLDVVGSIKATGDIYGRINVEDTRSTNPAPTSYDKEVHFEFKERTAVGVGGSGTYSGMLTLAPWGDNSGDAHHQLNFNEGGIFWRQGQPDNASWGGWSELITSSNESSYDDNNYASGLSFATGSGILTVNRSGLSNLTVNLDGRYLTSEVDGSVSNEGSLTVGAGAANTSIINSNTSGSTPITLQAGSNITLSEASNTITIAASGTGDDLGNHTATANVELDGNWLSNDGGSEGIRVDNNGNVGIGDATPTAQLDVDGGTGNVSTGKALVRIQTSNESFGPELRLVSTGTNGKDWRLGSGQGGNQVGEGGFFIYDAATSTERISIRSNGNVGISSTNPGNMLDINTTSSTSGIEFDNRLALSGFSGDNWLRLNQSSQFSNGTYTPTHLRADGEIRQGGSDYGAFEIQTGGQIYANDYILGLGGVHVGGTSDPGTDNLVVDGTSTFTGMTYLNGSSTITSNPPAAGSGVGWKLGLYSNTYALGIASSTIAAKTATWFSFFDGNPASNASTTNIDGNADVGISAREQNIQFAERSADITTPRSGFGGVYVKNDGRLYFRNDGGTVYDLTSGGTDGNGIYDGSGTLGGATVVSLGANNMDFNMNSTGDVRFMDGATTRMQINDNGTVFHYGQLYPFSGVNFNGSADIFSLDDIFTGATSQISINGDNGDPGEVLMSDGTNIYWGAAGGASTTIYNGDATLSGARTVSLGANNLSFNMNSTGDVRFMDGASTRMTINDNGLVYMYGALYPFAGIQMSNTDITSVDDIYTGSATQISINGDNGDPGEVLMSNGTNIYWGTASGSATTIYNGDATLSGARTVSLGANNLSFNMNSTGDVRFMDGATTRMIVLDNGNVGIGVTNPTYQLQVSGRIRTNAINETSDVRYKKNIREVENALGKVLSMRGVTYDWKSEDFPELFSDSSRQLGVIAQEMEEILPEVVHTDSEGYKSVDYSHMVAVLIEAIKDQQEIISQQNIQNQELREELENKIDRAELESILSKSKSSRSSNIIEMQQQILQSK
ncbi:MAG: tail fiber domain-containing protein [Flavobacteriales bacterium]|nr:tail fiber domain-containing protein [Flavobacteriales bacterium]